MSNKIKIILLVLGILSIGITIFHKNSLINFHKDSPDLKIIGKVEKPYIYNPYDYNNNTYSVGHDSEYYSKYFSILLDTIDNNLEGMVFGDIVFNTPKTINIDDSKIIHIVLGIDKKVKDIENMIKAEGEKHHANIRVSNLMTAHLSGNNFDITVINPETQAVAKKEPTEWKWQIKPKEEGKHNIYLTLSALFYIEGKPIPRVVKSFDKLITIEITATQQTTAFISSNLEWFWGVILIPLAWLWKRKNIFS